MNRRRCVLLIWALILSLPGSMLLAQDISNGDDRELIRSMGIPSRYEFSLSPMFVIDREDDETKYGGQVSGSVYRHILSPLYGVGVTGEGYIEGVQFDITASKVLSKREQEILGLIIQGYSNKEIARNLDRSVRTIEDHRAHIMQKLNADNLVELIQKSASTKPLDDGNF